MVCGQCGTLQPDESLFCSGCEHRLSAKEITLSGTLVAMLVIEILLCGAGGSWLVIGWASPSHKVFEAKTPASTTVSSPAKPSPAIASVDEQSYKPVVIQAPQPAPVAKPQTAPASSPAAQKAAPIVVAPPVQRAAAPIERVQPHATVRTAAMTRTAGGYTFGPYNLRLLAHQRHGFNINVPEDPRFNHATLSIAARASGGYGPRLRVLVYRDQQPYFDSSRTDNVAQNLHVSSGNYLVVLENDAIAFPRNVVFSAKVIPGASRP